VVGWEKPGHDAESGHLVFRRIITAIIVIPLLIVVVGFAVANRQVITVSFDPFSSTQPAYAVTLPLFVIIFILLIVGVIIGGAAAWMRQASWRRSARRLDAQVRDLHSEIDAMRTKFATRPDEPPPQQHLVLPPV
jgi:uncharacterized integral membrane protein